MGALAVIGTVVGAIGTGLSYAASVSAANQQEQFALLNAQAGAQQAQQQGALASLQAQLQQTQAQNAQRAAYENAASERSAAEMETARQQENIRRQRDEFRRQLSAATAQAGGSGVNALTGSPLEFLVENAAQEQQAELDAQWLANAARVQGYRSAAATELGGDTEGINASLFGLQSLAALSEGRTAAAQARLGGLAATSVAQGQRYSAFGSLVGGIGSNINSLTSTPWWRKKYG